MPAGLTGLEWSDFFCYANDILSMCERISFARDFLQEANDKVNTFFKTIFCIDS